jgi:predicted nucleotidyltransferase component of viral defense system
VWRSLMVNFYETGIAGPKVENIFIKIDLDIHPPAGAKTEKHIMNKHFMIGLTSYDLSTLAAEKINALLTRNYAKGRDYYDLFWYLTTHKNVVPNFEFLKNALVQFNWQGNMNQITDWKIAVSEKLLSTDWGKIENKCNWSVPKKGRRF